MTVIVHTHQNGQTIVTDPSTAFISLQLLKDVK